MKHSSRLSHPEISRQQPFLRAHISFLYLAVTKKNWSPYLSCPPANDMLLIPIEKLFSNRDSTRKAREAFSIEKGRTIDFGGLNNREETY